MNPIQLQHSDRNHFIPRPLLRWITAVLFIFTFHSHAANIEKQPLQAIEIADISISTPARMIAGILQAQSYTQINESLYTKQEQLQNGHNAIYRITIEDNAIFHQITYSRSLGGGRIKSPAVRDAPVPAAELGMAQQLYQSVCTDMSEEIQKERSCESPTPSSIRFGHGQSIHVDERFAVLLDATDASTTIEIKYIK